MLLIINQIKELIKNKAVIILKQTFPIGMKICNYYAVYINIDEYPHKEMIRENNINGFVQCLKFLRYNEIEYREI